MGDERLCPDDAKCHHTFCWKKGCWRVRNCEPLSGVFENDEWQGVEELARSLAEAREEAEGLAVFIDEQFPHGDSVLDTLPWRCSND